MINLHSNVDYKSQPILAFNENIQYGTDLDGTCLNYCVRDGKIYKAVKPKSDLPVGVYDGTKFVVTTESLRQTPVANVAEMTSQGAREFALCYVKVIDQYYMFKLTANLSPEEITDTNSYADDANTGKWVKREPLEKHKRKVKIGEFINGSPRVGSHQIPVFHDETNQHLYETFESFEYVIEGQGYWSNFQISERVNADVWYKNSTNLLYEFEGANSVVYYMHTGANIDKQKKTIYFYSSNVKVAKISVYGIKRQYSVLKDPAAVPLTPLYNAEGRINVVGGSNNNISTRHQLMNIKQNIPLKANRTYDFTVSTILPEVDTQPIDYSMDLTLGGGATHVIFAGDTQTTLGASAVVGNGYSSTPVTFYFSYTPAADETVRLDLFAKKHNTTLNHWMLHPASLTYKIREVPQGNVVRTVPKTETIPIEQQVITVPIQDGSIVHSEWSFNDFPVDLTTAEGYIVLDVDGGLLGSQRFELPLVAGENKRGHSSYAGAATRMLRVMVDAASPTRLDIASSYSSSFASSFTLKSIKWYRPQFTISRPNEITVASDIVKGDRITYDPGLEKIVKDNVTELYFRGQTVGNDPSGTIKFTTNKNAGITVSATTGKITVPVDGIYTFTLTEGMLRSTSGAYIALIAYGTTSLAQLTKLTGVNYNDTAPKSYSAALNAPKREILDSGWQSIGMTWTYYLKANSSVQFYTSGCKLDGTSGGSNNYGQLLIRGIEEK